MRDYYIHEATLGERYPLILDEMELKANADIMPTFTNRFVYMCTADCFTVAMQIYLEENLFTT